MKLIAFVGVVGFGAMTGGAAPDAVTFYEAGKTVGARIARETPSALAAHGRIVKADNTLVVTGSWDLSECGTIEAVFAEPAPERVRCTVMLENAGAVTPDPQGYHSEGTFRANLGLQAASNVTEVPIPPAMPDLQASVARLHMLPFLEMFAQVWPHPYWGREMDVSRYGTCFDCWTLDVAKPVVKVTFTWKGDGKLRRLVARGPKNVVQDVPAFAKVKPDDFLPLIDRYGQFKHKEWPGKIHSDADLKRALATEDADLAAHPGPASFDKWGGWKDGPKQEAKGHFYIKKLNGMWWFVDPDGNLWWSNGPLRVSPSTAMTPYKGREDHFEWLPPEEGDPFSLFYRTRDELMWPYWVKRGITNSFDFSAANICRKYGADWREKWAARAHRRLRSWGANTIGNSSDRKVVEMSKTPYVERFEIKSLPIRGGDQNFGWWPLRDPYDTSFAANVRQQLRERRYQLDDPWCVGFFVDNELPWGFEGHVGRLVWDSPEDQPAKKVFRRWLAERHGSVPATPSDEDFKAFSRVVPGEYFRQIRLAFDEVAPKKLYLGCRGMALEYIAKAAEPYVDAMSQNWYDRDVSRFFFTPPDDPNIGCAGLAAVDKPIVIGEFHMGARDRGPFWGSIVTLRDQNERAAVYRQYLTSALEHPRFIGAHWHHFSDEPTSGRFDGEAMQNGWTDVCDTPYPETVAAVRWVGENMYRIRWEAGLRNMSKDRLVAPADRPGDFRYDIVAKGPGKLSVRFERHVDGKVLPVYGAGADFVLSGREKTCTAEHTVPAGAWDALVLTGENIEVASVKVTPLARREAPELMRTADGQPVKDLATWEKTRRREIRELFENEIYGRRPAERPARLSFAAAEPDKVMMDGKAVRKRIRVSYGDRCGDSSFVVTAFVPASATREKPAPAFLLICNRDPKKNLDPERREKSGFWPAEQIVDRGYAAVAFFNGDVTTDARWDFTNGVYGVFQKAGERTTEDWGILSAWAWGASRVMDWIETEPTLDARRVAVVGHSRGGKTSLLAGVTDARFAMACVNDSGCGGAKLNHWNLPLSEHYVQIHGVNCWFCGNFIKYPNREQEVNFDAHWWMALMAPRLLAVASATEDAWAGQEGEFQAARLASPAWELYGRKGLVSPGYSEAEKPLQEGSVSYHLRVGKHDLTPYDWDRYMDFADRNGWRKRPELLASGVCVNGKDVLEVERRTFADGEAVRYRLPDGARRIARELTEWTLPEDATVWFQPDWDGRVYYEASYTNAAVSALKVGQRMAFPVTAKLADGTYRLITEANVVDYTDGCAIYRGDGRFGIDYYADTNGFDQAGADTTPWRVMLKAKDLQALATSDIVRRLCPDPTPEVADRCAAFVKPGRAVWQWLPAGDPKYPEQKDWYDRTKALGFEYYLIDDGWKTWRDGEMDQWACLRKWIDYGKSIGVESFIWVDSKEMLTSESRRAYLAKVKAGGAVGIKIDFIPVPSYQWMKWYEETLADTFAHGLMTDFHGCVKPSGRERTWPHEVAREAIRGHEWHITRYNRALPPEHDCILPFNRLVQGHADYTPVVFEKKELNGYTWARELAQGVVFSAPFLCFGDFPKNYLDNPAAELIRALPSVYDETRILPGSEIGECIAVAKRRGMDWFVAIENGASDRTIRIDFAFLGEGRYSFRSFADAENGPDVFACGQRTVTRADSQIVPLRACGGFVGWLHM